jgi:DNA repair protein RadC
LPQYNEQRRDTSDDQPLVVTHDHPSGNPEPSREDVAVTKQLIEAGRLMGIPVHDHLILAGRGYTSLAGRGLV